MNIEARRIEFARYLKGKGLNLKMDLGQLSPSERSVVEDACNLFNYTYRGMVRTRLQSFWYSAQKGLEYINRTVS